MVTKQKMYKNTAFLREKEVVQQLMRIEPEKTDEETEIAGPI